MTTTEPWIKDLARVHSGDWAEVCDEHHLRRAGAVSRAVAHLGVLRVLATSSGLPELIPAQDYRSRHPPELIPDGWMRLPASSGGEASVRVPPEQCWR